MVFALVLAHLLARPVGALMQRAFTTDPDVSDVEVLGIGYAEPQMGLNIFYPFARQTYFVHTRVRRPVSWFLRWI